MTGRTRPEMIVPDTSDSIMSDEINIQKLHSDGLLGLMSEDLYNGVATPKKRLLTSSM